MKNIYLINIEGSDIYKLGVTKGDPKKRLKGLQTSIPFALEVTEVYKSKYGHKLEKILHRHFETNKVIEMDDLPLFMTSSSFLKHKPNKLLGEFFKLSREEVKNFQSICKKIEDNLDFLKENSTIENI